MEGHLDMSERAGPWQNTKNRKQTNKKHTLGISVCLWVKTELSVYNHLVINDC